MAKSSNDGGDKKRKRIKRPYPACPYRDAMAIGRGIVKHASGERVRRLTLLEKMGLTATTGSTRQMITDSGKYGITQGSYSAEYLELTEIGQLACDDLVPEKQKTEAAFKLAIHGIEPFKVLHESFRDKRLPATEVLVDKLKEAQVDASDFDECVSIFIDNAKFLGLIRTVGGAEMLVSIEAVLDELPSNQSCVEVKSSGKSTNNDTVTVAAPVTGSNGKTCFVIMPFVERDEDRPDGFFKEVLEKLITPALTEAGFEVKTAMRKGSDIIHHTIVNELLDADLVLADLTEHNPNVLFELGLRMHADKPVVLIKSKQTRRIFDVDTMIRVEEYDPRLWSSTIESDLKLIQSHIEGQWQSRDTHSSYIKILRGELRTPVAV